MKIIATAFLLSTAALLSHGCARESLPPSHATITRITISEPKGWQLVLLPDGSGTVIKHAQSGREEWVLAKGSLDFGAAYRSLQSGLVRFDSGVPCIVELASGGDAAPITFSLPSPAPALTLFDTAVSVAAKERPDTEVETLYRGADTAPHNKVLDATSL